MEKVNLYEYLSKNSYPGRGILMGRSEDGKCFVTAYFIMGRSENSRNRIFVTEGEGIKTQAFDPAKLTDPSLIIYSPVRVVNGLTVVTNGDQTDTICEFVEKGKTFEEALRTRTFEPDAPNFTPRISGISDGFSFKLSILKSADKNPNETLRYFFEYENSAFGEGRIIHTYLGDGNPIPSFEGEPVRVSVEGDIDTFTNSLWESLDSQNKVSLFVRFTEIDTMKSETRIINKNV